MSSKGWLTSVLSGRKGKDGTDSGLVSVGSVRAFLTFLAL